MGTENANLDPFQALPNEESFVDCAGFPYCKKRNKGKVYSTYNDVSITFTCLLPRQKYGMKIVTTNQAPWVSVRSNVSYRSEPM